MASVDELHGDPHVERYLQTERRHRRREAGDVVNDDRGVAGLRRASEEDDAQHSRGGPRAKLTAARAPGARHILALRAIHATNVWSERRPSEVRVRDGRHLTSRIPVSVSHSLPFLSRSDASRGSAPTIAAPILQLSRLPGAVEGTTVGTEASPRTRRDRRGGPQRARPQRMSDHHGHFAGSVVTRTDRPCSRSLRRDVPVDTEPSLRRLGQ